MRAYRTKRTIRRRRVVSGLVLSRREGEDVQLDTAGGQTIVVQIAEIRGDVIKLTIEAPRDCRILRGELVPTPEAA